MTVSRKIALFAAIAVCTSGLPALASAATTDAVEISVPTADLNLNTSEGQNTLHKRIHKAARLACLKAGQARDGNAEGTRVCEEEAVSQARAAVDSAIRFAAADQALSLQASAIPH
jgi:UrcA family protein